MRGSHNLSAEGLKLFLQKRLAEIRVHNIMIYTWPIKNVMGSVKMPTKKWKEYWIINKMLNNSDKGCSQRKNGISQIGRVSLTLSHYYWMSIYYKLFLACQKHSEVLTHVLQKGKVISDQFEHLKIFSLGGNKYIHGIFDILQLCTCVHGVETKLWERTVLQVLN